MTAAGSQAIVTPAAALDLLLVATSYPADRSDWHGIFIRHIADALARRDDVQLSLWAPPGEVGPGVQRATTPDDAAWLSRLVARGGIAQLLRTRKVTGLTAAIELLRRLRRACRRQQPGIYHINWLQNALALPPDGKPALITALGADMQIMRWPGVATALRRAFRDRRVAICPNADWMVAPLHAAFGATAQVQAVPFGIDGRWFDIRRAAEAQDEKIWLVVSRVTRDKIGPLIEWCEPLFADGARKLHVFGPLIDAISMPSWLTFHGPASQDDLREIWFPRAQGLISLSRHAEGRPQVMLEAMASGLPVVASRLPAHADLLDHAQTGWLVGDAGELAAALICLEDPATNRNIGNQARQFAQQAFGSWDDCARRYNDIYRHLVKAGGK